jgi:hypothetical protein
MIWINLQWDNQKLFSGPLPIDRKPSFIVLPIDKPLEITDRKLVYGIGGEVFDYIGIDELWMNYSEDEKPQGLHLWSEIYPRWQKFHLDHPTLQELNDGRLQKEIEEAREEELFGGDK